MAQFDTNTVINGTLQIPRGTLSQRPGSPTGGEMRWNTTLDSFEMYDDLRQEWIDPATNRPPITKGGLVLHLDAAHKTDASGDYNSAVDLQGTRDASFVNNPTWSPRGGGCWEFNGSNQYINFGQAFTGSGQPWAIATEQEYTLEAWIYVRTSQGTTTSADSIIGHTSSTGFGTQVGETGGLPRINYGARSTSNFYGSTFQYNQWLHTIWRRRSSGGYNTRVLENGVQVVNSNTSSYSIASPANGNIQVGYSGPRVTGYFDGFIAEVRAYNVALTDEQMLHNFNATRGRYNV